MTRTRRGCWVDREGRTGRHFAKEAEFLYRADAAVRGCGDTRGAYDLDQSASAIAAAPGIEQRAVDRATLAKERLQTTLRRLKMRQP